MDKKVILGIGLIVLVVLIGAGFLLSNRSSQNNEGSTQVPSQAETLSPSPTASDEASMSEETKTLTVVLSENGFNPQSVTINAGDKIIWKNESGEPATVDSNPHPIHTSHPEMNLGEFDDGQSLEFVFPNPGTYNYHNHLNASQGGTIIVR